MTDSLLNIESLVQEWTLALCGDDYPDYSYDVYGRTEDLQADESKKPRVVVGNVQYTQHRPIALPGLTFTDWSDNDTSKPITTKFTKSTKTTTTRTTTVTVGLEMGFSMEESVNIEIVSEKMSFNTKISTSSTESETTTKEESWSVDKIVEVPSMKSVEMIWSIGEQKLDIDFIAEVTISGFVECKGWYKGKKESRSFGRTTPFSGFFDQLKELDISYPSASNIKYVGPKDYDVQFTLQGTLSGQNAVGSVFRAKEHPLRPPDQRS